MSFRLYIESSGRILYHVTKTSNVVNIKKKGILPLQTSNWVKGNGERYGNGEIFAFDHFIDAVRWAMNMDWAQNKELGTGKISIISFKEDELWDVDDNDPISQLSNSGKWLKREKFVAASQIVEVKPFTDEMLGLLRNK